MREHYLYDALVVTNKVDPELRGGVQARIIGETDEIDDDALDRLLDVAEYYRQRPNFANARTIRSVTDQVVLNQNLRAEDDDGDYRIILSDVEDYIADEEIDFTLSAAKRRIGF